LGTLVAAVLLALPEPRAKPSWPASRAAS